MQDNQQYYRSDDTRLITPWGYIGYGLLFAIPIVGLIFVLVYSFSSSYPCRRNYARSVLICLVIALVLGLIAVFGFGVSMQDITNGYIYNRRW